MSDGEGWETLAASLAERGWAQMADFLPPDATAALLAEAQAWWAEDRFQAAGVGRGAAHAVREAVRRDRVLWLDDRDPTPAQARYREAVETLRQTLNRELYLGLFSFEAHYAVYPPGAFYRKHLDRFADADERVLSMTFYLNPDWTAADGGQLRLHLDTGPVDILPAAGTLALFRSDTVTHEVLPANRLRYSLTGWFRRRSLRSVL